MHSFPLIHASLLHELVLAYGRTVGALADTNTIPEYGIWPPERRAFNADAPPAIDLSRTAGSATELSTRPGFGVQ